MNSLRNISENQVHPSLKNAQELIDSYNIAKIFSENEQVTETSLKLQRVSSVDIQSILGKDFRINYFCKTGVVEANFIKNVLYDKIGEIKEKVLELDTRARFKYEAIGSGVQRLKVNVKFNTKLEEDKLIKLFSIFNL